MTTTVILPEDAEASQPMEDSQVTETPRFTAEFIVEESVAGILTTEEPVSEEATAEESASEDSIDWFAAYNGEKLQRITAQSIESYSPALCSDIIFYRTEEGEAIDEILNKMIDAMIQPLTEPSEVRNFTITEYRLEEQAYEIYDENVPGVWILPYLNGYYSYTGTDFVTMETVMENEPELVKDGMVPFLRQGSEEVFVYILMQEGNVYRLQRAQDMEGDYR